MSIQENKALVRCFIEEVQNQHNLNAIDALFSPDFIDHSGKTPLPGVEAAKGFFATMFTAFPDMHFTIQRMLAEGDQVATHKTFHGTHRGPFMGIQPSGKQVTIEVMDIVTVQDGKITDHWTVDDALGMLQQLGVIPVPE